MDIATLRKRLSEFRLEAPYYEADLINFIIRLCGAQNTVPREIQFQIDRDDVNHNFFFSNGWDWGAWDSYKAGDIYDALADLRSQCIVKTDANLVILSHEAVNKLTEVLLRYLPCQHRCPVLQAFTQPITL